MPRPRKTPRKCPPSPLPSPPLHSTPLPATLSILTCCPLPVPNGNASPVPDSATPTGTSTPADLSTNPGSPSTTHDPPTEPSTPAPSSHLSSTLKRKRGRPSRAALDEALRSTSTPLRIDDDPTNGDAIGSDAGTPSANLATPSATFSSKKRRGRPPASAKSMRSRGGPSHVTSVPLDKDGNPQTVEDDEIVLPEDPAGEDKVSKMGYLQGGREYRCRTFTILGRGDRLYMLSTEPARCIGFRDSYLFFQKHKQLFKIIMDDDEKFDMIKRELIPHSYKGRAIGVVTARSVFREFGARIVVAGRKIIDDYWESRERAAGAVEGDLADPEDRLPSKGESYNRNQYVAWHGASSVYHTGQPSVPMPPGAALAKKKRVIVTDTNWMFEHANAASQFNSRLLTQRLHASQKGMYEPHTNLVFYPAATQPTRARWEQLSAVPPPPKDLKSAAFSTRGALIETVLETSPYGVGMGIGKELGLGVEIYDDEFIAGLETEEDKEAVRAMRSREVEWVGRWG